MNFTRKKSISILSIGNSFSQDSHKWLRDFAMADGVDMFCQNLYIGGCSLEEHFNLLVSNAPDYAFETNGDVDNVVKMSITDALKSRKWDIVTIQQVSHLAGKPETFEPYFSIVLNTVREICPKAKIYFHETWEYEYNSSHGGFAYYENSCDLMFGAIRATATKYIKDNDILLIPSGEAVHEAKKIKEFDTERNSCAQSLYRDGFHMHLVYGRYLLACVWYKTITGKSPIGNSFIPENAEKRLLSLLQNIADKF